jgi:hypothetical protein
MNEITNGQQNSATQQQPESPEVVGTSLLVGSGDSGLSPRNPAIRGVGYVESILQCFARSEEDERLSKELQELAQKVSYEKSSPLRADELLQVDLGERRYSRANAEAFKRKNRGNNYAFKKPSHY